MPPKGLDAQAKPVLPEFHITVSRARHHVLGRTERETPVGLVRKITGWGNALGAFRKLIVRTRA